MLPSPTLLGTLVCLLTVLTTSFVASVQVWEIPEETLQQKYP